MINNLAIDQTTGDLLEKAGQIKQVTGVDAVAQRIYCKLKTYLGEFWLNRELGVPYYQVIFKKGVDLSIVNTLIKSYILSDDAIIEITEYTFSLDRVKREFTIAFSAKTTIGFISNMEVSV